MAKIVIIRNPFQPWVNREIKTVPKGFTVKQAAIYAGFNGVTVNCVVEGDVVNAEDYVLPEDSLVTLSPMIAGGGGGGGKSILGIVAVVALSVVAMGVGNLAAGGSFFSLGAGEAWAVGSYLAAAAVMFVGSTLIGRMIGQTADLGNYSYDNDATYSWSGVQTMEGQNNAIALTYGTVKTGGQSIGKYINVKDNDEYLNWLVAAGEGQLTFSDIKLNDDSIDNYSDLTYETREGTNDQTPISNFNDTYFTKNVSRELLDDEEESQCQGNATEGIKIKLEFYNGLYYANDSGGLSTASAKVWAYYKKQGTDTWTKFVEETVSAAKSSAVRKEYRVDNLPAGTYDVKVKITNRSHSVTSSRASTKCRWTELTSIVYDDFSYPNIALLGIKAKATDQLSGSPSLTFKKTRSKVWVWNPYLRIYQQKNADNPAWASYDVLHLASKIKNTNTGIEEFDVRGVPARCILYDQFNEWATFCDTKNLKVNIEINATGELLRTINEKIACCGRGMVVRFGTKYGCVWQCAKQPVQMFGMGNIIAGTFKEEFLQTSDRANAVEITYTDKNNDYNRETLTIYAENYDTDVEEKTAQMTFDGITSYEQAYREGKFQLYCNQYQLRTVSFQANIDAIACTIGDVILVAHDVPFWAKSGRIYEVDINKNELLLPVELESTEGIYRVQYRTVNDNIYSSPVTIISNENGWCKVKCATAFNVNDLPQAEDIFDLALQSVGSKPFLVQSINRAQDFTREISCIEYNANIFNENYNIPTVTYDVVDRYVSNVTNLKARKNKYVDINGLYSWNIGVSWKRGDSGTFIVSASVDGVIWENIASGINEEYYSFESGKAYKYVRVVIQKEFKYSSGVSCEIEDLNYIVTPYVQSIKAETEYKILADNQVQYSINVSWDKPLASQFLAGEIWYKTSSVAANKATIAEGVSAENIGLNANWIYAGLATDSISIPFVALGDTYKIVVRSKYKNGDVTTFENSPSITYKVDAKQLIPNTPSNLSVAFGDVATITWDYMETQDLKYYEVGYINSSNQEIMILQTSVAKVQTQLPSREGTLYLYVINTLNIKSQRVTLKYSKKKPSAPEISLLTSIDNVSVTLSNLPADCNASHIYISGTNYNKDFVILGTTMTLTKFTAGAYNVKAAFVDMFGDGEYNIAPFTVNAKIDSTLLDSESVTLEKLSSDVQQAIEEGGLDTVNVAVKGILGQGSALTLQPDGSYALVASNGETLTGLFANQDGVMRLQGDYIHVTGNTVIDNDVIVGGMIQAGAITADKMSVKSLSAICDTIGSAEGSKARTEITGDAISVYDENGTLRVKIGVF